jgi:arylsulfatase A-like enzyme
VRDRFERTGAALAAGAAAGGLAGLVDTVGTALRGPLLVGFPVVACGVMAIGGAVLAVGLMFAARGVAWLWAGPRVRPTIAWKVAAVWGSLAVGAVLLGIGAAVFERETPPARLHRFAWLSGVALVVGAGVGRGVAAAVSRWPRTAGLLLGLPVVAAIVVMLAAGGVVEEVDTRFVWVGLAYAVGLVGFVRAGWPRRSGWVVGGALGLGLAALVVLVTQPAVRLVAARYSPATERVTRGVARLADLDGDGFSPLGGEGDCAPLDGSVHPFAVDVPGDGVDQDCHDGDLDPGVLPRALVPAEAPIIKKRPNVVFVSIETLRADHTGFLGYARPTTPSLDAWAGGGAVFERAYTVAPVTDRVMPAWLGGLYPSMFVEALDYQTHVMGAQRELLTERLQAAGYRTIVLHSYHLFDDHGLAQGIDELTILGDQATQDARWTTMRALKMVREQLARAPDQPIFLWIHYYEPHSRYTPPAAHALWGEEEPIDRYDGEIHYVDSQVGVLLERLRGLGVLAGAYVMLAADHGEEFLEHGRTMHAYAVYEETVRVPWVIAGPDVVARRIPAPVTTLDLAPTLLELVDVPPIPGAEGISQAAALRGGEVVARPFFIEQWRHGSDQIQKIAVVDGANKMILDLENQLWELYDVLADPLERDNRDGREPALSLRLRGLILGHRARSQATRWRWEAQP